MSRKVTIAIVQVSPAFLDLEAGLQKAEEYILKAAQQGANLVVFGESWLTGYPAWLDYAPNAALWDHPPTQAIFVRMRNNAVAVPSDATARLAAMAKERDLTIVIGINERVNEGPGSGTLYNSMLIFDEQGELVNHHRKLIPTYTERMLYGNGDGTGLKSVTTKVGRISGAICWEHWMPLTRQALHESGEDIHIALWPNVHEMHQVASRQYAFEGRCFVVAVGQMLAVKDFPEELALPDELASDPDRWILKGGSCVVGPNGMYVLEPVFDKEGLITVEVDLEENDRQRLTLDVTGHYSRADVFDFSVNRKRPS